jgi:hypothetical protein
MLRVYYGGPVTPAKDVAGLVNPDGTHRPLGPGQEKAVFLKNENLTALPTKLDSPEAIDASLTTYGPIIFNWRAPQGEHASVIVAVLDTDIVYHDPNIGPNQRMSMAMFVSKTEAGFTGSSGANLIRNPGTRARWAYTPQEDLALASDGVIKKYPMPWPRGWWRVWDGGAWYYYLADGGIAMSSKTAPSPPSSTQPPAKGKIHNTGTWRTSPNTLVIKWKKVVGAPAPCEETFYNAVEECRRMNATSTLYCPLEATRFPG